MHCGRFSFFTANAQLKVSSTGKVSVGTTQDAASTLSVGGAGHSNYAAYVNGKSFSGKWIYYTNNRRRRYCQIRITHTWFL